MIQEKDSNIARLRTDLGRTREEVREKERTIMELDRTRREIEHSLKKQIAQKDVRIEEIEGKLKVTFVDKILFDSGSTQVKEEGQQALMSLAESLVANTDETIIVEGHTDNVKIAYPLAERFPTNWELSTARAASVVRFLQEEASIEPERLTATGYGYYRPVAPNDSEESRRQNRRIEIILTPSRGGEPHRF
ncbi:MAG: OmpA family protein [Deltaproteobacteria bacterium]|nr:OmpA family protein [Deltaproteobacteria bacterium]